MSQYFEIVNRCDICGHTEKTNIPIAWVFDGEQIRSETEIPDNWRSDGATLICWLCFRARQAEKASKL